MIVMDLEWNYGAAEESAVKLNKTLKFEIIQIGAAAVDSRGKVLKTFDRLISPTVHHTIMPKVKELTGITEKKLQGQPDFRQAWQELVLWMGGQREIVFWGNCDRAVLLSNLMFFGFSGGEELVLYDLQALFDRAFLNSGQQTALSNALSALSITPYGRYHSALADAVNAASILQTLGGEQFIRRNLHKLSSLGSKKRSITGEGELLMERTFRGICDLGVLRASLESELVTRLKSPVREILPGFYRNHKKIWAYQSDEGIIKVTSKSQPSENGRGRDYLVKFFRIEKSQLDTLRKWSRKQSRYITQMRYSSRRD